MGYFHSRGVLPFLVLALLGSSCSRDDDLDFDGNASGSVINAEVVDFILRPTLVPELFAFSAVIDELRLVETDGTQSLNLLRDRLPLEFLHLIDTQAWLARTLIDTTKDYEALAISFVPGSYEALDSDGKPLVVDALSDDFLAPLLGGRSGPDYARLEVLFDLRQSLTVVPNDDDTIFPILETVEFDPRGQVLLADGVGPIAIDRVLGLVQARDTGTLRIDIDGFASENLEALIGPIEVQLTPFAALVGIDNYLFAQAAFFLTYLVPGSTIVDLRGSLGDKGRFLATRVELEDQVPQVGGVFPVMLEGRVLEQGTNFDLKLLLSSIPRGRSTVQPYLDGLVDPNTVLVTYNPGLSLFFVGENNPVSPTVLREGQDLTLKFQVFQGQPFPSWRADIKSSDPGFAGLVGDISDLPDSFELIPKSAPLTPVTVLLDDDAALVLDAFGLPLITPMELRSGLEAVVFGTPMPVSDGTSTELQLATSVVRVLPGQLVNARVVAVDAQLQSVQTVAGLILSPFGDGLLPGPAAPLRVLIDHRTLILGEASSPASLFELLEPSSPAYTIDVAGISVGLPQDTQVQAYTLIVRETF